MADNHYIPSPNIGIAAQFSMSDAEFNEALAMGPLFPNDDGTMADTRAGYDSSYDGSIVSFGTDMNQLHPNVPSAQMPAAPAAGYTQQVPAMPQNAVPNIAIGPSWNAATGWYYPAVPSAALPQTPTMPYRMGQVGYTPMAPSFPAMTPQAVPQSTSAPQVAPKRKYGPGAYLDHQANHPGSQARHVSASEANYTSAAKERAERAQGKPKKTTAPRKRQELSIVRACTCSDKAKKMVTRPRNAFILYRSANAENFFKLMNGKKDNQGVSKLAGQAWKQETEAVKAQYHQMAQAEAARHRADNPDYQYTPGLAKRLRFGSASCTCGAYQLNLAANQHTAGPSTDSDADFADESDVDGYNSFDANGSGFEQQVPTMTAPAPYARSSNTGFAGPVQQQSYPQANANGRKRKQDDVSNDIPRTESIGSRLRSRSNLNRAFQDDGLYDLFPELAETAFSAEPPQKKHRPSPITTQRAALFDLDNRPAPQALARDDSPARNTRAKSRASEELEAAFAIAQNDSVVPAQEPLDLYVDVNNPNYIDYSSWMMPSPPDHQGDWAALDQDNIIVASRRRSSSSHSRGRKATRRSPRSTLRSRSPRM